jgi:hypothetical protein
LHSSLSTTLRPVTRRSAAVALSSTRTFKTVLSTFTRSREEPLAKKVRFGFALGYLTGSDDPIKYSGFVCESMTPSINRRNNATLDVSILGPFEGTAMDGYTIPDCENPDPLLSEDCKIIVNSNWETTDVSQWPFR